MRDPRPGKGPGSNQHQDKPPRRPRDPVGDEPSALSNFLADPFRDADKTTADTEQAATAEPVPAWMLGGNNSRRTVGDQARHEQSVLEKEAHTFSDRGDAAAVSSSDMWAAVYRDFAVRHADNIDTTLRSVHVHHADSDGCLRGYDDMFRAAGLPPQQIDPADLHVGDAFLTKEPSSRQDAVAVVVARAPTKDGSANLTLVATTMEGFTAAYVNKTRHLGATVGRVPLLTGVSAATE